MKKSKSYVIPGSFAEKVYNCFKEVYPPVTAEETAKEYQARIVEEACNALSTREPLDLCGPWDAESVELALEARAYVLCSCNIAFNEFTNVEAEALLRCGWRPDGWGNEPLRGADGEKCLAKGVAYGSRRTRRG